MTNKTNKIIVLTLMILMLIILNAYGADTSLYSISINNGRSLNLSVDDYFTLEVKTSPSNYSIDGIKFSTSDPNVADVDYKGNVDRKSVV